MIHHLFPIKGPISRRYRRKMSDDVDFSFQKYIQIISFSIITNNSHNYTVFVSNIFNSDIFTIILYKLNRKILIKGVER